MTRLLADDSPFYLLRCIYKWHWRYHRSWSCFECTFNQSKTKAIYSLKKIANLPNLCFEDRKVLFVGSHKHLGVSLSSNGHWDTHIENITQSTSKVIGMMRRLKFTLNRKSFKQIYVSYIARKHLHSLYRYLLWIPSKTTKWSCPVSLEKLYCERGWQSLKERRELQKLYFMCKVNNEMVPTYSSDLIPSTVGKANQYP